MDSIVHSAALATIIDFAAAGAGAAKVGMAARVAMRKEVEKYMMINLRVRLKMNLVIFFVGGNGNLSTWFG